MYGMYIVQLKVPFCTVLLCIWDLEDPLRSVLFLLPLRGLLQWWVTRAWRRQDLNWLPRANSLISPPKDTTVTLLLNSTFWVRAECTLKRKKTLSHVNYFGCPPVLCLTKHTCMCVYYAIEDSSVYNVATQLGLGRLMEANHVHIVPEVISSCDVRSYGGLHL